MIEKIRSGPLLSLQRAIFTYAFALAISLVDMYLIRLLEINTPEEVAVQTLIHGTGFYLAYTVMALFNTEEWAL